MLEIFIPNNNLPERRYIIGILFENFLGVDHRIEVDDQGRDYSIRFDKKELLIRDAFFGQYPGELSYLIPEALPDKVSFVKHEFAPEVNIPVIYGSGEIRVSELEIRCGMDIFASSFFMLTRWEEIVNPVRDRHDRFPGDASVAFRNGFLHRPLVNEYVEFLWKMLEKLGYRGKRKERDFELTLTHDVDSLSYVSPRSLMGDVLKRRDLKLAAGNLKYLLNDPHDTYDYLMDISESLGVQSRFYFMSALSNREFDSGNYLKRPYFRSTVKKIRRRGHLIGFHPGYYTFDDARIWRSEKERLEEAAQQDLEEGRQHFLRMDVSVTPGIWEENGMKIDSTMSYSDKEGFRCGTGDKFPVFSCRKRVQYRLIERPLVVMDGSLKQYQNYTPEKAIEVLRYYVSIGKKYKSNTTFLFHNSSFALDWADYRAVYSELPQMMT